MIRYNNSYFYFFLILASAALLLVSCARPANPSGGPGDETPPSLVTEESTANFQTRFAEREIVLEFDEFITLSNASQQIVISPPFTDYLKYTVRGRKLYIEFPENEELREDATYQINFGSAIRDFTAGNELENFTFVFSTGDVIDSLTLSGYVFDAATAAPSAETLVVLYDNLSDTAFQTEKPFYFAKTDEGGKFQINNIKSDTFQVFALSDQNLSLTYDQGNESIAFLDSLIMLPDTNLSLLTLLLFDERETPLVLNMEQKKKERAVINFSSMPRDISLEVDQEDAVQFEYELQEDSCIVWYKTDLDSFEIFANWEGELDTLQIRKIEKKKQASKFACRTCKREITAFPKDTIEVEFNKPIGEVDLDWIDQVDSLDQMDITELDFDGRIMKLLGKISDTGNYELILLPGSVRDIFGEEIDTSQLFLKGMSDKVLGNIVLTIQNVNLERQYLYELLDDKEELVASRVMKSDTIMSFDRIPGGKYSLRIIEDLNENGFWDSGNLKQKLFSEKIRTFTLEELRDGWDLETSINVENEF